MTLTPSFIQFRVRSVGWDCPRGGMSVGRRRGAGRVAQRRLTTREGAGELGRCLPAEPRMRRTNLDERGEQRLVQEFVAQPAVERLDEGVLDGLSRRDVVPLDPGLVGPAQDGVAGELRSVVADDHPRLAACRDQPIEFGRHPQIRERCVGGSGRRRRAWRPPASASARESRLPAPAGAWPRRRPCRRTWPSTCRGSHRRRRVRGKGSRQKRRSAAHRSTGSMAAPPHRAPSGCR